MGLKENFSQAVKELTGGAKEEEKKKYAQVNDLKKAMDDEEESIPSVDAASSSIQTAAEVTDTTSAPYFRDSSAAVEPLTAEEEAAFSRNTAYQQPAPSAQQQSYSNQYSQPAPSYQQPSAYQQPAGYYQPQQPVNTYAAQGYSTQIPPTMDNDEMTIISKNTVIDGNIRSFANMNIDGNIKGNVETTKNVALNGKIVGDLTCNNANMQTSQIQGNVHLKGGVVIERDTLLIGDINSTYANINGKLKGNVNISGKAEFKADAIIFGDISASTITVDDGAIIQGYVSTTFLNKEESVNIFPDAISIGE